MSRKFNSNSNNSNYNKETPNNNSKFAPNNKNGEGFKKPNTFKGNKSVFEERFGNGDTPNYTPKPQPEEPKPRVSPLVFALMLVSSIALVGYSSVTLNDLNKKQPQVIAEKNDYKKPSSMEIYKKYLGLDEKGVEKYFKDRGAKVKEFKTESETFAELDRLSKIKVDLDDGKLKTLDKIHFNELIPDKSKFTGLVFAYGLDNLMSTDELYDVLKQYPDMEKYGYTESMWKENIGYFDIFTQHKEYVDKYKENYSYDEDGHVQRDLDRATPQVFMVKDGLIDMEGTLKLTDKNPLIKNQKPTGGIFNEKGE